MNGMPNAPLLFIKSHPIYVLSFIQFLTPPIHPLFITLNPLNSISKNSIRLSEHKKRIQNEIHLALGKKCFESVFFNTMLHPLQQNNTLGSTTNNGQIQGNVNGLSPLAIHLSYVHIDILTLRFPNYWQHPQHYILMPNYKKCYIL